jgi:hypothetical protein
MLYKWSDIDPVFLRRLSTFACKRPIFSIDRNRLIRFFFVEDLTVKAKLSFRANKITHTDFLGLSVEVKYLWPHIFYTEEPPWSYPDKTGGADWSRIYTSLSLFF